MDPGVVLVEETRNGRTQALHTGHAVLLDADGEVLRGWGDPTYPAYWRSAPKALQAIPFAGVLDDLRLDARALALACASHSGEAGHVAWAEAMLNAGGLDPQLLRCGTHPPMTRHSLRPEGGQTPLHNNCSGKHAAMLLVSQRRGWPLDTYRAPEHPLQQEILGLVAAATGRDEVPTGIDGCGIPTFFLPISDLARAYQWTDAHPVGRRCIDAMAAQPWYVAGTDRFCTVLAQATQGLCIGKVGAAGVYTVLHRPSGQALAVKVAGGDARAAETAAGAIAVQQGWLHADDPMLRAALARRVTSNDGTVLGSYVPRLAAPSEAPLDRVGP